MKTDFCILWVDDNKDFAESLRSPLESWLEEKGFGLVISRHKSANGVAEDLKTKEIELIVMDYKLPKKNGDVIIEEIRAQHCFQDVVFYSQGGIPEEVGTRQLDGVFYVDRGDAIERVQDLISLKLRRATDIVTVRGWIVADAIELEIALGELLARCFLPKAKVPFVERLLGEESPLEFGAKYKLLNGLLKDYIAALRKDAIAAERIKKLEQCKKIVDLFPEEVIEVRNAVAHQKAEFHTDGHRKIKTKTKRAKEIIITDEECVTIRKNLRKHSENFQALLTLLGET